MKQQTYWVAQTKTAVTRLCSTASVLFLLTGCVMLEPMAETATGSDNVITQIAQAGLSEIDQKLFERLANLFDTFSQNADDIWTDDYRFDQMPMLLVYKNGTGEVEHGYLINHPNAATLPTAQQVEMASGLSLPPVYRLNEMPSERVKSVRNFDFQAPIADVPTFVMAYNDPDVDPFSAPVSADWDAYVIHEALHDHQMAHWYHGAQSQDVDNYLLDGDSIADIQLEHKLLVAAYSAVDEATRDRALQQFVAVRSNRIEQNFLVETMDNEQERYEGTARYIEYQLAQFIPNPAQTSMEDYLEFALAKDAGRDELAFGRFYTTGAALSVLLDRVNIPWKSAVEDGKNQYEILSDHFGLTDNAAEKSALLATARETYDYAKMQQDAAQTAKTVNVDYTPFSQNFEGEADFDEGFAEGTVPPDGAIMIEPLQKPYEPIEVSPLTYSLPDGYTLQGGFEATYDELKHEIFQIDYSPGQSSISFVDYEANGDQLRVAKSRFDGTISDVEALEAKLGLLSGRDRTVINEVEVLMFSVDDPNFGLFTAIGFAHDGYWYSVSASISAEQMTEIAAELISK